MGTSGDDTFIGRAGIDYDNPNATADGGDTLDGGAGRDTLRVSLYENDDDPGLLPATTNIEVLEVNVNYDDNYTVSAMEGLEEVRVVNNLTNSAREAQLYGFTNLVDVSIVNTNQDLELNFASNVASGDADEMTVTFDRAGESYSYDAELDVRFQGEETLETLNIVSQGPFENIIDLYVDGGITNVNISGDTDLVFDSVGEDILDTVENITVTGAMNINLDDEADLAPVYTALETFDGSTGTGDQEVDGSSVTTSMVTGSGDDDIEMYSDVNGTTTVTTNDGDDVIEVIDGSKTMLINTGAGSDELQFEADFQTSGIVSTSTMTVDMGAGDDDVEFETLIMADLPASWEIDGGDGTDSVYLGAGVGRTFNAGDYVTLTESLVNFENLDLLAGFVKTLVNSVGPVYEDIAQDFAIDASRLSSYNSITFIGKGGDATGNDITVTKAAADQTIGIENFYGEDMTLTVSATGYVEDEDQGGDLKVVVNTTYEDLYLTANGDVLNLTVETGEAGGLYVAGDIATLNATLNAEVETNDDDEAIGVEGVYLFVDTDDFSDNLTAINLSGVGEAEVYNDEGGKLATIDASGLTNSEWDNVAEEVVTNDALNYNTTNASVAETIKLGSGFDSVDFGWYNGTDAADRWSSSYAKMDTVQGLNLVAQDGAATELDFDVSDTIYVDTDISGQSYQTFQKLSSSEASTVNTAASLGLALQTVAQLDKDYVVFQYQNNTYIYGDTGALSGSDFVTAANDQLDDTDLVVKLTGTIDLNLLIDSLMD